MSETQNRLTRANYFEKGKHLQIFYWNITSTALHSHDFFEIEIVLKGNGTHVLNAKDYPLQPGMIWLCTPADFHELILDEPAEYWSLIFDESVISPERYQSILDSGAICTIISPEKLKRIDKAVQLLNEELATDGNIRSLMEYILETLLPAEQIKEDLSPIRQAILYTETFFKNKLTLTSVASQVGLSPTYFGNLFKKETGETYINYLNHKRVTFAMNLLDNGMSVSSACFESGFGSLSGFLHTFKKITGISPNEYRNRKSEHKISEDYLIKQAKGGLDL